MNHHHIKVVDVIVIWLLLIVVAGVGIYLVENDVSFTGSFLRSFNLIEDPLSTKGFIVADVRAEGRNIIFREKCKEIVTSTTADRAYALHLLYQGKVFVRPTTYDLIRDMMEEFGAEVKVLKIFRLREGMYVADVVVEHNNRLIKFDARPSDAIALAFKDKKPIYVEEQAFLDDGTNIC